MMTLGDNVKVLEVRDRGTLMPVMAMRMQSDEPAEAYGLERSGYGREGHCIVLMVLDGCDARCDPYEWNRGARTIPHAHRYIEEQWNDLKSGDVVDVEYILFETLTKKTSERSAP